MSVPMTRELRCAHLRQVCPDPVSRLLSYRPIGSKGLISATADGRQLKLPERLVDARHTATEHGRNRCSLGYRASMLVEESRMLQVSIFQTLQNNLASIDFSLLLIGVMTIVDEVDSQLSQAMAGFTAAPPIDGRAA
jgi:hypothetical protein